jgi:phage-related protein (TIGR01555 family)
VSLLDQYGRPIPSSEEREDAWANPMTGLGVTGADKTRAASYLPVWRVLDQELTSLYNGSDIAAKIVSKPVEEQFRRGFEIEADNVSASEVDELREFATEYLDVENNMREGKRWGRLYGGTLLVMGIDDGRNPWDPLDEENIRSFDSLALVDRRYSYVQSQYAAMNGPKYGKPQVYLISNAVAGYGWNSSGAQKIAPVPANELRERGAQVSLVHESRVIRFDGNPADVVTRQNLAGWSWSVLQRVYDAMKQFDGAFDAAAYLLSDASQGVFKLQGLIKAIGAGQRAALAARLQLLEMSRSVMRGIALDAGGPDGKNAEDFTRVPTPFTGIPDLLDRMMLRLSAAADMPATELFGRAPAGLNATGEADTRKWYDLVESNQKNELGPQFKRVFRLLALAKKGPLRARKVKWKVLFKPLWAPTDKEMADTRLANAQRDEIYVGIGAVKPEEVAVDLFEVYPNLDVQAREEVLAKGVRFDPYENEPAPENSAGVAGKTQGEPLSPKAPVPLYGTTGTNVTPGVLPAIAKSGSASKGAAGREPGPAKKTAKADAVVGVPDVSIVLVWNRAGELLTVTRPEPPHEMAIPGGHVEPGETPEETAVRELLEETAIAVSELRDEGKLSAAADARIVHVFTAGHWEGEARAVEANTRVAWLTPDALWKQSQTYRAALAELKNRGLLTPRAIDRADAMAAELLQTLLVTRQDAKAAGEVFTQLLDDYPAKSLGWVLAGHWEGPDEIDTADIDSSSRDTWRASHEPIAPYIERIEKRGGNKPIILVRTPSNPKYIIVDGHHRFLASEQMGRPVDAYWAEVHTDKGPWDELHSMQKRGSSKGSSSFLPSRNA